MEEEELYCSACSQIVQKEDEFCTYCGSDLMEYGEMSPLGRKYKTLLRIKESLKIIIALVGTGLIISLLYSIYKGDWELVLYTILPGMGIGLLLVFLELINLFVDLEQSSRTQVKLLHRLLIKQKGL
jgi:hypothetical protein